MFFLQLRGQDLNLRTPGYEPGEGNRAPLPRKVNQVGVEPTTFGLKARCSAKLSY